MRELKTGDYNVLSLDEIVKHLHSPDHPLPPKTVAITFDGAWLPTLDNVLPLLEEYKFPFTVFFASDMAEEAAPGHMDWPRLKKLKKNKRATLGILPSAYAHMTDQTEGQNAAMINRAPGLQERACT